MTNGFSVKAEKLMSLFMKSNVQTNKNVQVNPLYSSLEIKVRSKKHSDCLMQMLILHNITDSTN